MTRARTQSAARTPKRSPVETAIGKRERRKHPRPWDPAVVAYLRRGGAPVLPVRLTLAGTPRTKKNGETMTKVGTRTMLVPSAAYRGWEREAVPALVDAWKRGPIVGPVNVAATIYRERAGGDAANYYNAIADILEEAGVVVNDALVVSWDRTRMFVDKQRPRVELLLVPVGADMEPVWPMLRGREAA